MSSSSVYLSSNSVNLSAAPGLNLECEICRENYDSNLHKPMIFIPCGHGACSSCSPQLRRKCQTCRTNWQMDPIRNFDFSRRLEAASQTMVASVSNHIREAEEKKQEEVPDLVIEEEVILDPIPAVPLEANIRLNSNEMQRRLALYILTYLPPLSLASITLSGYTFIIDSSGAMFVDILQNTRYANAVDRIDILEVFQGAGGPLFTGSIEIDNRIIDLGLMSIRGDEQDVEDGEPLNAEILTQLFPNWNEPIPDVAMPLVFNLVPEPEDEPIPAIQGVPVIGEEIILDPIPAASVAANIPLNEMRNQLAAYIITTYSVSVISAQINCPRYDFRIHDGSLFITEMGENYLSTVVSPADRLNSLGFLPEWNQNLEGLILLDDHRIIDLDRMSIRGDEQDVEDGEPLNAEILTQIFPNWNEPIHEIVPENEPIIQEVDDPVIEIAERNPESRLGRIAAVSRSLFNRGVEGVRNLGSAFRRSPSRTLFNLVARPLNLIATAFSRFEQQRIR